MAPGTRPLPPFVTSAESSPETQATRAQPVIEEPQSQPPADSPAQPSSQPIPQSPTQQWQSGQPPQTPKSILKAPKGSRDATLSPRHASPRSDAGSSDEAAPPYSRSAHSRRQQQQCAHFQAHSDDEAPPHTPSQSRSSQGNQAQDQQPAPQPDQSEDKTSPPSPRTTRGGRKSARHPPPSDEANSDDEPPPRSPPRRNEHVIPSIEQQLKPTGRDEPASYVARAEPRSPTVERGSPLARVKSEVPAESGLQTTTALIDVVRTSLYALETSLQSGSPSDLTLSREASDNWEAARAMMVERLDPILRRRLRK